MIKFIDANIFIEGTSEGIVADFVDNLDRDIHCTSTLVLIETYHKIKKKKAIDSFRYIRTIMSAICVLDITQDDLFSAIKNPIDININDKIHIEVMKRNNINTIVSFDKDFNKDKTIKREEI